MSKELIERLALEVCDGIALEMKTHLPNYSIHFAKRFLSAYLAERGKEADSWLVTGNYTRQAFASKSSADAYCQGLLTTDPEGGYVVRPLFLAPQIPEGIALVKIEDLERARDNLIDGDYESARRDLYCLIAAAGVTP